jgi:hypothetical protein
MFLKMRDKYVIIRPDRFEHALKKRSFRTIIKQMQGNNAIQAVAPRRLSYPCLCEQAQNPTELRLWKDEEVQVRYIHDVGLEFP